MSSDDELLSSGEAWRNYCDRLKAAGESIIADGFPNEPRDRAEGFRWLTRLVVHATQMEVEAGDASECQWFGVAIDTASIDGSSSMCLMSV